MADDKDDDAPVSWNDFAEGDEERLGISKDVLRKLMQMNPALRGGRSTEDLLRHVKAQMKEGAPRDATGGKAPAQRGGPGATMTGGAPAQRGSAATGGTPVRLGDISAAVTAAKLDFEAQQKRLDAELKRIENERAAFQQRALAALLDACLEIDPALASPQSQRILQQEKAFLDKLGFSAAKLAERRPLKKR